MVLNRLTATAAPQPQSLERHHVTVSIYPSPCATLRWHRKAYFVEHLLLGVWLPRMQNRDYALNSKIISKEAKERTQS